MAIASGLPMPKAYVIDDPSPNAFATGRNPKHAVIAATTGLLDITDRYELEGVVAHEMSHIQNYDVLVQTVAVVLAGMVMLMSNWMMRSYVLGRHARAEARQAGGAESGRALCWRSSG